ncbi:hypothetical protein APSETT444_003244 [Aspergillus pseudonomiae]
MDSSNNDVGCRADRNDKGAATSSVSATRRAAEDLISPASASRNATEHIQRGVRNVEDVTSSWPRKALIAMFLLLIQRFGQFKWLGMGGVPFMLLGTGLLIHFRTSQTSIGYVVMCQVFNGVAGSTLIATQRMAAQSSVGHENLAVITALIGLFSSLGAAIGSTVATAIWTNLMPHYLREYLPAADQKNLPIIYGSLVEQLQYPWGSPTRIAIVQAYTEVQQKFWDFTKRNIASKNGECPSDEPFSYASPAELGD